MINRFKVLFKNGLSRMAKILDPILHPARFFSQRVFIHYGRRLSQIPYPFFTFVVRYNGGPAMGTTILHDTKKAIFIKKLILIKNFFLNIFTFSIFIVIILGYIYFFGLNNDPDLKSLVGNLLSDFIFLLFVFYALPHRLRNNSNPKLKIETQTILSNDNDQLEISTSITNISKNQFAEKEIYWDFFIPFIENDFIVSCDCASPPNDLISPYFTKTDNFNHSPLFPNEKTQILKLVVSTIPFTSGNIKLPLYYSVRTPFDTYPRLQDISLDLISSINFTTFESMPKYGLYEINEKVGGFG